MKRYLLYSLVVLFCLSPLVMQAQTGSKLSARKEKTKQILPGAWDMDGYLSFIQDRRVGLLINQTSRVGEQLLLDTLLKRGVKVVKVFVPEHGIRGTADAGEHVKNGVDSATRLPIISLYGNNKKPTASQLQDIDVLIYDLQDVGARFYTYISTLEYAMIACAENNKQLMVLDRPNPNGHYVDGPVLKPAERSFIGMQPIPVVYGMTVGEYARMLEGEKWISDTLNLDLMVVSCVNYDHTKHYTLPVPPSPNLKTANAVQLYPSLCFFEGTVVSVGRGTDKPFEQWGHPTFKGKSEHRFTPVTKVGASKPLLEGQPCWGVSLAGAAEDPSTFTPGQLNLQWLITAYNWFPDKKKFFIPFFEKLAGTKELRRQIEAGMTAEQIRASWKTELDAFKAIRSKYLLYKDFE